MVLLPLLIALLPLLVAVIFMLHWWFFVIVSMWVKASCYFCLSSPLRRRGINSVHLSIELERSFTPWVEFIEAQIEDSFSTQCSTEWQCTDISCVYFDHVCFMSNCTENLKMWEDINFITGTHAPTSTHTLFHTDVIMYLYVCIICIPSISI